MYVEYKITMQDDIASMCQKIDIYIIKDILFYFHRVTKQTELTLKMKLHSAQKVQPRISELFSIAQLELCQGALFYQGQYAMQKL